LADAIPVYDSLFLHQRRHIRRASSVSSSASPSCRVHLRCVRLTRWLPEFLTLDKHVSSLTGEFTSLAHSTVRDRSTENARQENDDKIAAVEVVEVENYANRTTYAQYLYTVSHKNVQLYFRPNH